MQEQIEQVQKQFEEDSQQIASVSESTLLKILSHNKGIGQKKLSHNVVEFRQGSDFRRIGRWN